MDYGYRMYVTDGINACAGNLVSAFGTGSEMSERWSDIYKPQEKRDAESIKKSITEKIRAMRSDDGRI